MGEKNSNFIFFIFIFSNCNLFMKMAGNFRKWIPNEKYDEEAKQMEINPKHES